MGIFVTEEREERGRGQLASRTEHVAAAAEDSFNCIRKKFGLPS